MEQVAVRHVQLHHLESGGERPMGCGAELGFDLVQFGQCQGVGHVVTRGDRGRRLAPAAASRMPPSPGDRRSSHGGEHEPLRPVMGKLDPGNGALLSSEAGDGSKRFAMRVAPDAAVAGVMRPSGLTAVASTMTSPAHPPHGCRMKRGRYMAYCPSTIRFAYVTPTDVSSISSRIQSLYPSSSYLSPTTIVNVQAELRNLQRRLRRLQPTKGFLANVRGS